MAVGRRTASWALLAAFVAALLAACAAQDIKIHVEKHHHKQRHIGVEEDVACSDVARLGPQDDRCAFVREHCTDTAGLLNYPRLYYCGAGRHGALLAALMVSACALLLVLLFRVIARASDDYFSCILSQISQDLGLPPRLGGVTLLALGNGAPDLSASIEAVKTGEYQLAMGALTGAGMFVGAVVAGRIITLSGGVRARGAQLRDIGTQLITVAVVMGIVASGWFSYGSVIALLSIYAAYVALVAVADFSKRLGVEWGEIARNVSKRMSQRFRVELTSPLLQADYGSGIGDVPAGTPMRSRSNTAAPTPVRSRSPVPGGGGRLAPMPEHEQLPPSAFDKMAGAAPIAAGQPPLALGYAGSLPHDIEAAANISAAAGTADGAEAAGWTPAGATAARFASLPDIPSEDRLQEQHQQQHRPQAGYWANRQLRHGPPLAHFQPHMTYGDIVQMSAREYRQRALAEMAQSRSFFARRDGRVHEQDRFDSDSDGEQYYSGEEGPAEYWEQATGHPSPRQWQQQRGPPPWPSRSGSGSGGSADYQPPVVQLDATLLAAREAVAEFEAQQAAARAAGTAVLARVGRLSPPPGGARGGRQMAHQESSGSGGSTAQFSVASLEVAPPVGGATPLPLAADEQALGQQEPEGPLQRASAAAQWPFMLMLQATIPLVEANSYQRPWFLRSLATSPLFIAAFLQLFTWQALLVAVCAGAVLCTLGYFGTLRLEGKAPLWTLGTGYPIGAALLAVYGFGVAAMWISFFASEIVGLLQFFGMLSKMEPAVLGVTVLAWGNSLMDYFNNTAMAGRSRGGNSMAMTACFAGPLFNMLVGLGCGFWALLQESHAKRAAVSMDPVVLVGCLFTMLNCAGLIGVSLTHRQWLPAWCGWAMIGCYCAYMTAVLAVLVAY